MKQSRSPLAVLFFTIFIDLMGFGIIIPILPNLAVDLTGMKASLAVAGVYALFSFIFAPLWGSLSDKYGRRPIILVSILLMAVSNLYFGFITAFWMLIVQRALSGAGSANISAANAYIADISTPENRTKNMGLVGAAFGLGFVFGPFFGGLVYHYHGLMGIGVFSGGLSFLNFIMAYFLLPESLKEKQKEIKFEFKPVTQIIKAFKINIVKQLLSLNFVFTLAFSMMYVTAAVLWEDRYDLNGLERGYVFSFIGIASAIVQGLLVGKMNKRFGEKKLLYAGLVFGAIGLGAMPFIPVDMFWMQLIALAFTALANGCITPSILGLLSNFVSAKEQGKMLGLNQSAGALARVFGPALGGILYDLNFHVPYVAGSLVCLASVYIVYDLVKKKASITKADTNPTADAD